MKKRAQIGNFLYNGFRQTNRKEISHLCSTLIIHKNCSICKGFWSKKCHIPDFSPSSISRCRFAFIPAQAAARTPRTYTTTDSSSSGTFRLSAHLLSSTTAGAVTAVLTAANASPSNTHSFRGITV